MKKIQFLILFSIQTLCLWGQKSPAITVEVSGDTIGLNGTLEVQFTIENAKVNKWTPPAFEGFEVQGPSTSSMMSMVNGDVSQKMIYTYFLTPRKTGRFTIGKASVNTERGELLTGEKDIVVLKEYVGRTKPKNHSFFGDDDDDDLFFRRRSQPAPPQTPTRPETPKKKKYETEKI
jgi:hypothetical protein